MSSERRARELANFEIDTQPRKQAGKGGSGAVRTSASSAARSAGGRKASGTTTRASGAGAKKTGTTARTPATGTKKSGATARTSATGAKKATGASARTSAKTAGTRTAAASARKAPGTSARSTAKAPVKRTAASGTGKAAPKRRNPRDAVQENPLARWDVQPVRGQADAPRHAPAAREALDPYDSYDDFDAPVRQKPRREGNRPPHEPPKKPPHRKKRGRSPVNGMTFLLLLLIAGMAGVGVWRQQAYAEFTQMKAVVAQQNFYAGTTVEGVDVSEMTLQQALDYWNNEIEPGYREVAAVLNDGAQVTAAQMGYTSDYDAVLASAWNAGRQGSLVERYNRIALHTESPSSYTVRRSMYSDETVRSFASRLAEQIDMEAQDARLLNFDFGTQTFQYQPEQAGRVLNQEALVASVEHALESGGGQIAMEVNAVQPSVTLENVSSQYGMISSAVTNASSSSSNRLSNIALAISLINGTCLEPGETFSFNQTVGERTTARGFKTAPAYYSGEVTQEVGGGICQVSTTLFNAAVKANLTINERHAHSLTVSYVDAGKDAAVDWGNKDLRFTNSTDERVYICCYLSDDKRVHFGVFGKLLPDGMTITLESKKTGDVDYETEYRVNFTMASGSSKVVQNGKKGSSAVTYKVYWDANGNELSREQLCKSNYRATKEIIEYGP